MDAQVNTLEDALAVIAQLQGQVERLQSHQAKAAVKLSAQVLASGDFARERAKLQQQLERAQAVNARLHQDNDALRARLEREPVHG